MEVECERVLLQGLVAPLLACVQQRLSAQDQDQEVKEAAITCAGACIAVLGDISPADTASLLQVAHLACDSACLAAHSLRHASAAKVI